MHRYKNSFPAKLFRLIDDAERRGYGNILSWTEDGKAFTVHRIKEYCEAVMPLCFRRQSQFKSFTRQLYIYGFQKMTPSQWTFSHPNFVRGDPKSAMSLKRNSSHEDRRIIRGQVKRCRARRKSFMPPISLSTKEIRGQVKGCRARRKSFTPPISLSTEKKLISEREYTGQENHRLSMHHLQANDSPESNGLAPQDVESMQSEETNASTDDQDFVVYNSSRISDPLEPRPIEEMMLRQSEHNYPDGLLLYRGAFIGTFEKSATQKHLHFIDNQQKISDLESGCPF